MKGTVSASCGASAWTKAACLFALLAAAAVAGAQTTARGPIVTDIVVTGNQNVSTYTILSKIKTRAGRPFDQEVLKEDERTLLATGSFRMAKPEVRTTPDGKFLVVFQIEEHPNLIQDVIFKNSRHLKPDDIETLKTLKKGTPLNPYMARKAVNDIKEFYRDKGYYFAEVVLEEGGNPGDKRVIFNITEGHVVRVNSTRFVGNATLATAPRLRTQIDTSRKFLHLPIMGVFRPVLLDGDVLKLQEYYKNNGYLDATVSRELYFSDNFRDVDIVFHIYEGPRYHVKQVAVDGAKNVSESELKAIVRLKPNDLYNETAVITDTRNIQDYIGWRGFKAAAHKELYVTEPGLVTVHYEVEDQQLQPSKVGNVIIQGNEVTKERIIRRVLGIYPGQTLEYPQLRLAQQALVRTQIFETNPEKGAPTVEVDPRTDFPDNPYKDILVTVKEAPTGSLMLGVGVNSSDGLVGNIVLNERNFDICRPPTSFSDIFSGRAWRGAGQEFRVEASPGTVVQRYTVSFREPYLFDLPYSLGVSAYYWDRIYTEYTEHRLGTRFVLGHQFGGDWRYWSIAGSIRVEGVGMDNVSAFAPEDFQQEAGQHFLVGPRLALIRDDRDSILRPTKGSMIEGSVEEVLGDFNFPVINLEAHKYFTVHQRPDGSGKQVLALRSVASWAGADAPIYERFYGGGFQTIRGFAFRGVGPFEIGSDGNLYRDGGDFMFLNSVEYQIPIKANDNLYAVAFVDSGTVERNMSIHNYRVSAGFGLRIVVPMMGPVPIALDFGFPIVRQAQDETQLFSFYVGLFR
jgi:outer membrane protein insertion porin family